MVAVEPLFHGRHVSDDPFYLSLVALGQFGNHTNPVPHYLYEKTVLSNSDYSKSPRRRSKSHKSTAKVDSSCPPSPSSRRSPTRQHRSHDSRTMTPPPQTRQIPYLSTQFHQLRSPTPPLSKRYFSSPRHLSPTTPPLSPTFYGGETFRSKGLPPSLLQSSNVPETPRRHETVGDSSYGKVRAAKPKSSAAPVQDLTIVKFLFGPDFVVEPPPSKRCLAGDHQVRSKSRQRFNTTDCVVTLPLKSALAGKSRRAKSKQVQKVTFAKNSTLLFYSTFDAPAVLWQRP